MGREGSCPAPCTLQGPALAPSCSGDKIMKTPRCKPTWSSCPAACPQACLPRCPEPSCVVPLCGRQASLQAHWLRGWVARGTATVGGRSGPSSCVVSSNARCSLGERLKPPARSQLSPPRHGGRRRPAVLSPSLAAGCACQRRRSNTISLNSWVGLIFDFSIFRHVASG